MYPPRPHVTGEETEAQPPRRGTSPTCHTTTKQLTEGSNPDVFDSETDVFF